MTENTHRPGSLPVDADVCKRIGELTGLPRGGLQKLDIETDKDLTKLTQEDLVQGIEDGTIRIRVHKHFLFGSLVSLSEELLKEYTRSSISEGFPPVHVVIMQAAALECLLNDVLIDEAEKRYGGSRKVADGLLSGSFRARLYRVAPLLSGGTKMLNSADPRVQVLEDLITTRNRLVHITERYTTASGDKGLVPHMQSITVSTCRQYQDALSSFTSALWNAPPWDKKLFLDASTEDAR